MIEQVLDNAAAALTFESRVPMDHPLRTVIEQIDFNPARDVLLPAEVRLDPALALKLYFLAFVEDIGSEQELIVTTGYRIDWLWFCGISFKDRLPDLGELLQLRRTWGPEHFEGLLGAVIRRCAELKLIDRARIQADQKKRVTKDMWNRLEHAAPRVLPTPGAASAPLAQAVIAPESGPADLDTHSAVPGPEAGACASSASSPRRHGRMVCEMLTSSLGPVIDLSAGGMKVLYSGRRPPRPNKLQTIKLRSLDGTTRLQACVVWARRHDARTFVLGVQFENLTPSMTERLKELAAMAGVRRALRPLARRAA